MTILNSSNPYVRLVSQVTDTFTINFRTFSRDLNNSSTGYTSLAVYEAADALSEPQRLVEKSDYIVINVQNETAQVKTTRQIPVGHIIIIFSDIELDQPVDFTKYSSVSPQALQLVLDRLEMQIKQVNYKTDLAVQIKSPLTTDIPPTVVIKPEEIIPGNLLTFSPLTPTSTGQYKIYSSKITENIQDEMLKILADIQDIDRRINDAYTAIQGIGAAASQSAATAATAANTATLAAQTATAAEQQTAILAAQAANSAAAALQSANNAQISADKAAASASIIPDPANTINDMAIVTKNGAYGLEKIPVVQNLDVAPLGSVIVTAEDVNHNRYLLASSKATTSSAAVSTVSIIEEGGPDVSSALSGLNARVSVFEAGGSLMPWGSGRAVFDFIPNADSDLVDVNNKTTIANTGADDVSRETIGNVSYYTTGADFTIPDIVFSKAVADAPCTLILGFVFKSGFEDATLLNKPDLQIEVTSSGQFILIVPGANARLQAPLALNEFTLFAVDLTLLGISLKRIILSPDGQIGVTVVATENLSTPIRPGGFVLTPTAKSRLFRAVNVSGVATEDELSLFANALFKTFYGYGLFLSAMPTGFTLNNKINVTTGMVDEGDYNVVLTRDNASKTITLKAEKMIEKPLVPKAAPVKFENVSHTTPVQIVTIDPQRAETILQNQGDGPIYFSTDQATLASQKLGFRVLPESSVSIEASTAVYIIAGSLTDDLKGSVVVQEFINS